MQKAAIRRSLIGLSVVLAGCVFSACDTAKRLKSKVVAINLLMDIGDPFDLAPRRTELAVSLMAISGPVDEPESTPLTGADVTLEIEDVPGVIQLAEVGADGTYTVSSGTGGNASLVYQSGASYAVIIDVPSGKFEDQYDLRVTAPPRTNVTGLPDTQGGQTITAGQPLTVTLTGTYDRGIYIVLDSAGNVTEDSRPETAEEALDFAFGDFEGQLVIPGSAFPAAGTAYGVVIVGLESASSGGISTNLNILSRFYAGSAKTAIVVTAP